MSEALKNNRGLTLIELVVTMVILGILGAMILPSARMTQTRVKEMELKRNLREIRTAIDNYKKKYDKLVDEKKIIPIFNKPEGYPEKLETLVDGDDFKGAVAYKEKFLRRIPDDPFHPVTAGQPKWGMRSMADEPDSTNWGGENVFDVYSLSDGTAIDGTKYKDW